METYDLIEILKQHNKNLELGWGVLKTWHNISGSLKQLTKVLRNWDYPDCVNYFILSKEELALYTEIEKKRRIDPQFDRICKGRLLFELLVWYAKQ